VQSGDNLASLFFLGNDGTDLAIAAEIKIDVDGTPGNNDMPGRIVFKTTPDGSEIPVEAMRITSAQNVTLSTGNLVIGTSGKGIDFSANTSAAGMTSELLNWYEEGTFTPVLTSTGGGAPTYSSQLGRYTRIGNTVHYFVQVYLTSLGTLAAGSLIITGLPYNASQYETVIIEYSSFTSSLISVFAQTNASASTLSLYYQVVASTGLGSALSLGNISATAGMVISGTYFV
jgi:hypothetical protein